MTKGMMVKLTKHDVRGKVIDVAGRWHFNQGCKRDSLFLSRTRID